MKKIDTQWGNNLIVNINNQESGSIQTETQWGSNIVVNVVMAECTETNIQKLINGVVAALNQAIFQNSKDDCPIEKALEFPWNPELNLPEERVAMPLTIETKVVK